MGKQELIKIVRKVLKIVGWFCFTIFSILVVLILLIRLPSVQNKITKSAVSFLEDKIGTKANLQRVYIGFPKKIVLEGIYLEDQASDTLLYVESLSVNTDLWGLMKHRIQLNSVQIENATTNVSREQKTVLFNFDYIINAFSDSTAEKDPSGKPWDFSIGTVELLRMNAVFKDDYDSNYVKAKLGELTLEMDVFDLPNSVFDVSAFEILNSRATINLSGTSHEAFREDSPLEEQKVPTIDFGNIHLDHVRFDYAQKTSGQKLNLIVGDFEIEANKIDIASQLIDLDEIEIHNTFIGFYQSESNAVEDKKPSVSEEKSQWHVMAESILLSGNSFQFENGETADSVNRFDPNHLWVYDIFGEASDIELNGNKGKITLKKVRLKDKNGFTLETLEGMINLDEKHLTIDNFLIATHDSKLSLNAKSSFNSLSEAIESYKQSPVKLDIDDSYISLKDVLFFSPALLDSVPLTLENNFSVKLDAHLEGTVENLSIREFSVQVLDSTRLTLDGIVTGLPDFNSARARLNIENIHTTESDIRSILPDTLIPPSIQLPKWIDVAGKVNGTMNTPDVNLKLTSDVGSINVTGKMSSQNEIARYTADVMTDKLNVGRILKQPDKIGLLDMTAHVKGEGLSMDALNVNGQVVIDRFGYNDYVYEDFALKGSFKDYFFTGEASLKDENLDFVLKGDMDYQSEVPVYKLKFDLKNADFNALHLSKRFLKARAILDVNLATQDLKSINGNMDIRNVAIYNGESLYKVDSLLFASIDQEGESEISIRSDIITGDFKGTFNVFTLPGVIKQQMNRYFSLQDTLIDNFEKPQNFKFDITLKNTDLLTEILVPELEPFRPGKIQGEFDSEENLLKIDIGFADVAYSTISADSVSLLIDADKRAFNYKVRLRNIRMSTLNVSVLQFGGEIANDSILTSLVILDSLSEEKYHLEALIESENKAFLFHFIPDEMLLNYDPWRVPDDNMLTLHKGGFTTHNLELLKDDERLSIITSGDSTAIFRFTKFQLANLTKVVGGKVPAGGIMNGDVQIFTSEKGSINSELEISSLSIFDKVLGDMNFSVQKSHSQYKLDMGLIGDQMKLLANGSYDASDKTYQVDVNFAPLNLTLLESLSFGQLKNVKGLANGKLRLESQSGNPVLDGKITFSEASFLSSYVNNTFSIDNQTLEFNKSKLLFNKFELRDAENNKAVIDGNIESESLTWFDLDLNIITNNFQLLNTKVGDNEMYYGKLKVNSKVKITGSSQEPKVDMSLKVSDDSDLTYIVPISEKNVMERKGIVRFVDRDAVKDSFLATIPDTDTIHSLYKGINLTANIELTDKSLLTIVIDPATGDKLSVNGNANLVLDINASGAMNLSGRYDLTKGTYNFSFYNLTKRDFAIERGSTIVWSGDPLNATMDIRALYELETSPLDLVYNQINSANQSELNRYSQRLPFMVYLMIKGRLLEPEISFSLDMPENKRSAFGGSIYAKLQDINSRESDLNKQVFSLLILKRFISDNPFESQATSTLNNTARQSVSRLLSDQLNRLSENVKGVQLNFDIKSYEDYSGEQVKGETKVQLGVTKNLFNDRLVVKLSGNVDVEGGQQQAFADYIGDIALEYKLTSDGRFRITGFRNSNYDMIDGELIETGAGLIYIKDYNTLRELLRSNAKE